MITSTSSSQVKHVVQLQKKARTRKEKRQFVVEGIKMVAEAPRERLVKVYASETFYNHNPSYLKELTLSDQQYETVSDSVFMQMSDTKTPQGILAVVQMLEYTIEDLLAENPLILAVENLQDPGNLGTILRMGEGAGITGVLMSSNTVDIYNPKTIRSTMGSIYRVPFVYVEDFQMALTQLQQNKVQLCAAHLKGACAYTEADYTKATAILIGNEANGLTDATSRCADTLVQIPMEGQVESFNAAIACTILTFEAVRQRRLCK